jgi:putative pyruvate formate lyase activating enzyme
VNKNTEYREHTFKPGYRKLFHSGELSQRLTHAYEILSCCTLCPRQCKVNRLKGEKGFCGGGNTLEIAHYGPHFGEEPPLTGDKGAGTIFFTHCNLKCSFCQNHQISHEGIGYLISEEKLGEIMLHLQALGCHNIDLVTPSHFLPFILKALSLAAAQGLRIPLVYNSSGYESPETLKLLEGIIDIYLPDWKYAEESLGNLYSNTPDYPLVCQAAVKEMYRQVGEVMVDDQEIALRGLIIRHLVLPGHLTNSEKVLALIRTSFPDSIRISLMSQYAPQFRAQEHSLINRPLNQEEYQKIRKVMETLEFGEYWIQELESQEVLFPDFKSNTPFTIPEV